MPIKSMVEGLTRNWWKLLLRGILAIVFGVMAFAMPGLTLMTLALLYGAYALMDGVLASWVGATSRGWGLFVFGLAGIAIGVFTLNHPWSTALALLSMIGAWAIVRGVFEIVTAIQLRNEINYEWSLIFSGLLSIGTGLLFLARPGAGALALVGLIGAFAVVVGVLLISLAFRVRNLPQRWESTSKAA